MSAPVELTTAPLEPNDAIACTSSEVESADADGKLASVGDDAIVGFAKEVDPATDIAPPPAVAGSGARGVTPPGAAMLPAMPPARAVASPAPAPPALPPGTAPRSTP